MFETAFDIAAMAMRYFFTALIGYILFRLIRVSLADYGLFKRRKAKRAGSFGSLEVVAPEDGDIYGEVFTLRQENTIGKARRCDIQLDEYGISPVHAAVYEKRGNIYLSNYGRGSGVLLNGERVRTDQPLFDGDLIELGRTALLVRLVHGDKTKNEDFSGEQTDED